MSSPFLLWRVTRGDGAQAECLLVPGRRPAVVCYLDGRIAVAMEFRSVTEARQAGSDLRRDMTSLSDGCDHLRLVVH